MKKVKLIVYLFFGFMAYGCNSCYNRIEGVENLGDRYYFTGGSSSEANIVFVFAKNPRYEGIGMEVIPAAVTNFNYDNNYIIVRSQSDSVCYWIIDKSKPFNSDLRSNVIGPLDSSAFKNILSEKDISLDF